MGQSAIAGIDTTIYQEFVTIGMRQSVVVIGPSGSGKTMGIAIPSVCAHNGPVMFSSTKLDGLRHTVRARASLGRLWVFDPTGAISDKELADLEKSAGGAQLFRAYWSPLKTVTCWDEALLAADDLVSAAKRGENEQTNAQHWEVTSKEYLAPMLLAAALHPDGTMDLLRQWIRYRRTDECEAILHAMRYADGYELDAQLALQRLHSRSSDLNVKHASDVWSTLNTMIATYEFRLVVQDAYRQNFDPQQFLQTCDTIYIAGSSKIQKASAPHYVALIDALYDACVARDRVEPFGDGSDWRSLLVVLDEIANTAPNPRLIDYLSQGPGQGFQLMIFLQSGSQARTLWRQHGEALLDYPAVKVIFGGISDRETLEAFSVLTGDYDRDYVSRTVSRSYGQNQGEQSGRTWGQGHSRSESSSTGSSFTVGSSTTRSHHKERQLTPGDIATLNDGEALVVTRVRPGRNSWQIVTAGGWLIPVWIKMFLYSDWERIYYDDKPDELDRVMLDLAPISDLVAWHKAGTKPELYSSIDDDDGYTPRRAIEGFQEEA